MYVEKDAFLEVKSLENTQPNLKICQIILTWETILREKKEWNDFFNALNFAQPINTYMPANTLNTNHLQFYQYAIAKPLSVDNKRKRKKASSKRVIEFTLNG